VYRVSSECTSDAGHTRLKNRETSPYLIVLSLWLLVFSASSQIMIISPILPLIGEQLDIADTLLGTLVTAYSLMVGLFAIISGPISDRIGRRRILLMGTGIMVVSLVCHYLVVDYFSFLAVRVFSGMAGGILSGAAVSYIGDCFPYNKRGWALGWVMSGSAFGQIFGIPMGVVLAGRFGFRAPFYLFAVTTALTYVLIWMRLPQPPICRREDRLTIRGAVKDYWSMLRRREIASAAVAFFLMFLGVSIYIVYLPTWLERSVGFSPNQIASLFLVGFGGWAIGMRNMIIYELEADYAHYLEALGAPRGLIRKYAFRNAILPQLTGLALQLGVIVAGALVTEVVFSYPGIGYLLLQAIQNQDYFLIQGCFLFIIIGVLLANFAIDIAYILVDPRTRTGMLGEAA